MRKIPLSWIITAASLVVVIILNYVDPVHLSEDSFLTRKWVIIPAIVAVFVVVGFIMPWMQVKLKSPVVRWLGGKDSYNPMKLFTIHPPKMKGDKQLPYRFKVVACGSVKALNFYTKGGGNHGFRVVLDLKGMVVESGVNLDLNVVVWKRYEGEEEKEAIWWIHERLNDLAETYEYAYDINSPIYVGLLPADFLGYGEKFAQEISAWWESEEFWQQANKKLKDENKKLHQQLNRALKRDIISKQSLMPQIGRKEPDGYREEPDG